MGERYDVFVDRIDGRLRAGELLVVRSENIWNAPHVQFAYSEEYLASPAAFALSPDLPLKRDIFYGRSADRDMLGAFADAMPDRWGRRLIERKLGQGRLHDIDYLLNVPDFTRQGALRIRASRSKGFLGSNYLYGGEEDLIEIHQAIQRFTAGTANDADIERMLLTGSQSNGGQFPKTALIDDDGELCIAKFQGHGEQASPHWEAVCLDMARDAGIEVPAFKHLWIGAISVLIEKRFDRIRHTEHKLGRLPEANAHPQAQSQPEYSVQSRLPYISADTFMVLPSRPTYQTPYSAFAEKLHRQLGPEESQKLFERVAFLLMVNNTDDHWKNHGLLQIAGQWRLAPLFDVNPTTLRDPYDLPQLGQRTETKRSLATLLDSAAAYGFKQRQALDSMQRIARVVSDWRIYAERYVRTEEEIEQRTKAFVGIGDVP